MKELQGEQDMMLLALDRATAELSKAQHSTATDQATIAHQDTHLLVLQTQLDAALVEISTQAKIVAAHELRAETEVF